MEGQKPQSQKRPQGFLIALRQFIADRRGVGAVEFALIAPLLLSLYITSFELTIGFSVSKRVTHSADTIADLVAREASVNTAFLATMPHLAASIFVPYTPNKLSIKITGVTIDADGNPIVAWSWQNGEDAPYAVGSPVDVPEKMRLGSSFLIRSEVLVKHDLLMFMSGLVPTNLQEIPIGQEFFYRQRFGDSISCTDCG